MRFNLKLFVLVGVFVGLRDVCGMENKDDGFIVEELKDDQKKEVNAAVDERRVIKAVYKARDIGRETIIDVGFKGKLSSIIVWDGEKVEEVKAGGCTIIDNNICYEMKGKVEYTVYFVFQNELLTSTASMFWACDNLIHADLRFFNTTNVTDMSRMFLHCSALKELNLSKLNTINVTNMQDMFNGCSVLEKLDLSKFDTTSVKDMSWMFARCTALKELNLSTFNTEKVENMSNMFSKCSALTELNLSNFNTQSVTDMSCMFSGCTALRELNLSKFDFSNVNNIVDMFLGCKFANLCIPNTRERRWCCCGRYVYLTGKVAVNLNPNNWEFEVVHDDLVSNNTPSLL